MSITAHISVNVSANVSLAKPDDIFIFAYNNLTTSDTGRLIMTRENLTPIIDFPLSLQLLPVRQINYSHQFLWNSQ